MEKIKVKWLIAHEPEHLFVRTARAFKNALEAAGVNVEVEVITKSMFQEQNGGKMGDVMGLLEKNGIQMTQTQVHVYGDRYLEDFLVLDMPFLFRDHDHATAVLEGEVGQKMCADLGKVSAITGLAFTYSGGWRIIGSKNPINTLEELSNCKIRVNKNPINMDTMLAIGANPQRMIGGIEGYGYDKLDDETLDAVESTYLRFEGESVLKTNHSMFLTNISINTEFLNSLEPEVQQAFRDAAFQAAKLEREESIADAATFENECTQNGVTITEMSEEDRATFKEQCAPVYAKYRMKLGSELFDRIENA